MTLLSMTPIRAKTSGLFISTDDNATYQKIGSVTQRGRNRNISEIDITTDDSAQYDEFIPDRESSDGTFAFNISRQVVSNVLNYDDIQALADDKTIFLIEQKVLNSAADTFYLRRAFITSLAESGETRGIVTGTCNIRFTGGPFVA